MKIYLRVFHLNCRPTKSTHTRYCENQILSTSHPCIFPLVGKRVGSCGADVSSNVIWRRAKRVHDRHSRDCVTDRVKRKQLGVCRCRKPPHTRVSAGTSKISNSILLKPLNPSIWHSFLEDNNTMICMRLTDKCLTFAFLETPCGLIWHSRSPL